MLFIVALYLNNMNISNFMTTAYGIKNSFVLYTFHVVLNSLYFNNMKLVMLCYLHKLWY